MRDLDGLWRGVVAGGLVLSGCAGAPHPLPPQAPVAPVEGQMTLGRVVAVRDVTVSDGQGVAGLNAVLAALDQGGVSGPVSGEEVVVRQDDGTVVTVAQRTASGFAVGDEVGIVASAQTVLIHR